jgi:hypothetical protein
LQNNQLVVVVPVFRDHFSDSEILSLRQLYKHKNKYKIISITPNDLPQKSDFDQNIQFNNRYFVGTSSYSKLLLSKEFYTHFLDYEYILIYQLDCIILSDDLKSWCELGYDYIGAPLFWNKNKPENGFSRVGNGGLSLRKVNTFLKVLNSQHVPNWYQILKNPLPDRSQFDIRKRISVYREMQRGAKWYANQYSLNEDLFWSDRAKYFYPNFKIAPVNVGLQFAFEAHPRYCYEKNNKNLPFGAHAWEKWGRKFWEKQMKELSN